jgi:hypothetical protein
MLRFNARLTTAGAGAGAAFFELFEDVLHGHALALVRPKIHSMYRYLRVNFPLL